ncbi:hypothetical protein GHJ84_08805 [Sinorhizobium meliloti]|uniref:hypothetical protein n=1 Tax=Rhizobium meliloti TaxID=382 RepID=UPI001294C59A|nr:hypothetical protein [Sinorhizobium meliloti]MQX21095.1 hypothetical protein [Sinorhizobium meliloti]
MEPETAKYLIALDDEIRALWRTLKHHSDAAEFSTAAQRHRESAEKIQAELDSYQAGMAGMIKNLHEEAARYINVVSVIGYTGYFATWAFTKDVLDKDSHALIGLLGMISVALFCLWEMFGVFIRLHAVTELSNVFRNGLSISDFEKFKQDLIVREAKRMAILGPAHKLVFLISSGCVFSGGLMMMHLLYASLG